MIYRNVRSAEDRRRVDQSYKDIGAIKVAKFRQIPLDRPRVPRQRFSLSDDYRISDHFSRPNLGNLFRTSFRELASVNPFLSYISYL